MSYGIIILSGTMLLMLPITVVDIEPLSFVDALFMSASAVCVSGVSIFSLGDNFFCIWANNNYYFGANWSFRNYDYHYYFGSGDG